MKRFIIAIGVLCIFTSNTISKTFDAVGKPKTYGGAQVSRTGEVEDAYSFRCNIKGWPAIIGEDISVRIAGVQFPDVVAEHPAPNKFFQQQTAKFLTALLKNSKTIELASIRRGKDFCLVADVIVDANSLAQTLIDKGLAKKIEKNKPAIKKTGEIKTITPQKIQQTINEKITWIASSNSKVFHKSTCRFAKAMKPDASIQFATRQKATETGRRPCKTCKP